MKKSSIIIPLFNCEQTISKLIEQINKVLENHNIEFILVNDCSTDSTHQVCLELYKKFNDKITYIKLKKNMGEHNASMAGLNFADGDKVFIIDDDFQNSPEDLKMLFDYSYSNNFDVVYTNYKSKKHNFIRNILSKINDRFANYILNKPNDIYLSSFKSINKSVVKKIIDYKGPTPYIDGIIFNITSNLGQIYVNHSKRKTGNSNYNFLKLIKLFSNFLFNFTTKPLHIIAFSGAVIVLISFIFGVFVIIEKLLDPLIPTGYTSIVIMILFFSGIQLFFIGLIGEYVGRVLSVVNNNPQYSIDLILKKSEKDS